MWQVTRLDWSRLCQKTDLALHCITVKTHNMKEPISKLFNHIGRAADTTALSVLMSVDFIRRNGERVWDQTV